MADPFRDALFPSYLPFLFRKKSGAALKNVLPEVFEVYKPELVRGQAAGSDRAKAIMKVGHVTIHSVPGLGLCSSKSIALFALALLWLLVYPLGLKLRCLTCAAVYSCTEATFTQLERGRAYTSFAQFWANLLYLPILLDGYFALIGSPLLCTLLFPFNVWLLEIVEGHLIIWIYGHNVAWCYLDYDDCYCNGCIRLGHAIFWIGLGATVCVIYPLLVVATTF